MATTNSFLLLLLLLISLTAGVTLGQDSLTSSSTSSSYGAELLIEDLYDALSSAKSLVGSLEKAMFMIGSIVQHDDKKKSPYSLSTYGKRHYDPLGTGGRFGRR
ncbi:hypothetical protein HELRODRAFT_168661 [Helobdella robusta]|uniref:Uncharacterized protein n=1 Tax=Helobdella robusta TaxID=6412 RepID=T1F0U5_HELRO|nr:hypothetical protein HELRODRAFT_168661 [Helobdella robusta]ESO08761.1 hypothetical protein HELRODRAFT_168661 [Helobdella robusta]